MRAMKPVYNFFRNFGQYPKFDLPSNITGNGRQIAKIQNPYGFQFNYVLKPKLERAINGDFLDIGGDKEALVLKLTKKPKGIIRNILGAFGIGNEQRTRIMLAKNMKVEQDDVLKAVQELETDLHKKPIKLTRLPQVTKLEDRPLKLNIPKTLGDWLRATGALK